MMMDISMRERAGSSIRRVRDRLDEIWSRRPRVSTYQDILSKFGEDNPHFVRSRLENLTRLGGSDHGETREQLMKTLSILYGQKLPNALPLPE